MFSKFGKATLFLVLGACSFSPDANSLFSGTESLKDKGTVNVPKPTEPQIPAPKPTPTPDKEIKVKTPTEVITMDTIKDVHIEGACGTNQTLGIDIKNINIKTLSKQQTLVVSFDVDSDDIYADRGYREYYFWVDTDPSARKGFIPYGNSSESSNNPSIHAWNNFYADYKIIYTVNKDLYNTVKKLQLQNCSQHDCSEDGPYENMFNIVKLTRNRSEHGTLLTFEVPYEKLNLNPNSTGDIQVGITTYASTGNCHGEDDAPNWQNPAYRIGL